MAVLAWRSTSTPCCRLLLCTPTWGRHSMGSSLNQVRLTFLCPFCVAPALQLPSLQGMRSSCPPSAAMSLFLNVLGHKWYFVAAGQLARQRTVTTAAAGLKNREDSTTHWRQYVLLLR